MAIDPSRLVFPPMQKRGDPLTFELVIIAGATDGVRASIPWLEERGLKWTTKDGGLMYAVTLPDADSAMYFKLAFCG